jgi:antitoxin component of MazEF toxin-antitoxin module
MITTLTKHGNGYALIIDEAILGQLKIDPESPVEVSAVGDTLLIRRAATESHEARVAASLAKVNQKHAKAFKRLAE